MIPLTRSSQHEADGETGFAVRSHLGPGGD